MKARVLPYLKSQGDAIGIVKLKDYEDFNYVIKEILLDHPYLIYRGQRDAEWPLGEIG